MSLRILTVSQLFYPDTVGGTERVVYEQSKGLARRGHEVTVVVQRARKELPDEEMIDGIRVIRYGHAAHKFFFGASQTDLTAGVARLRRLLAAERFDVVVLHNPTPAYAYFKARGGNIAPVLYMFHASVYRELLHMKNVKKRAVTSSVFGQLVGSIATPLLLRRVRTVERSAILQSQRIAVLSEFSRELALQNFPIANESIVTIPGGVDLETFRPHPNVRALRQNLGLPNDRMVFLTVRRLVSRMGIEELLHAAAELLRMQTNFQLVIGGAGPERERLVRLARSLGIWHSVQFLGFIPPRALPDYDAAADLFVLPSVAYEGFGIATLEALACGTPVLGTPIGASPELINALDPSLIVAEATPTAIADGLRAYMARPPADRETLRRKARELAETTYPWSRSVDLLENTLLELAAMMPRVENRE